MLRPTKHDASVRKLIRKIERMQQTAEAATDWECGFMDNVKTKLSEYGTAFVDKEKGDLSHSLSIRQHYKMHEIKRNLKKRAQKA